MVSEYFLNSPTLVVDWVPIGPRFSNGVLQALMVLMGKRPPKVRRNNIGANPRLILHIRGDGY